MTTKIDARLDQLADDVQRLEVAVGTLAEDVTELRRALCELALRLYVWRPAQRAHRDAERGIRCTELWSARIYQPDTGPCSQASS